MSVIRPLQDGDFAAWLPLWRGYQAFYKTDIPEPTTRATFGRMLDSGEPVFAALAWDGAEATGLVHWILHRSTWTLSDYCYLQDLFVAPDARGGGLGRQLIDYVYAAARDARCSRVYWLTHETNHDAMLLYDRMANRSGFVQYRKTLD